MSCGMSHITITTPNELAAARMRLRKMLKDELARYDGKKKNFEGIYSRYQQFHENLDVLQEYLQGEISFEEYEDFVTSNL